MLGAKLGQSGIGGEVRCGGILYSPIESALTKSAVIDSDASVIDWRYCRNPMICCTGYLALQSAGRLLGS